MDGKIFNDSIKEHDKEGLNKGRVYGSHIFWLLLHIRHAYKKNDLYTKI